ncbi:MAG TPA: SLC13 family permease [Thermoanaerobaculia bacterium]|nr:SLC13 family permease [Thermoanaerobaculia bacterium]
MRRRSRSLLHHPVVRTLLFERFLITGSATLAFAAVAMGRVKPSEIRDLLDTRILTLFFVLTVAVELGKASDLFDRLVAVVIGRARTSRGLAFAMIGVTALLAAILTNDVALFLVVPFTMLFPKIGGLTRAPFVVLEVLSANLLGAVTPIGNPQNIFLYERGRFTPASFFGAQLPFAAGAAVLLVAAVFFSVPRRELPPPAARSFEVDPLLAAGFFVLLAVEVAGLFGFVPHLVPLLLSVPGLLLLGRRVKEADFSLVVVFALLFVGIPGLERGRLYHFIDPEKIFGHHPIGMLFSGALLSQAVSNVPAALLLAPAAATPHGFRGLLYGVTAGACGSPVGSVANLIGAQIYVREGGRPGFFWRPFCAVSGVILVLLVLFAVVLLTLER